MKVAVVAVTGKGAQLGLKVAAVLRDAGHQAEVMALPGPAGEVEGVFLLEGSLVRAAGDLFAGCRGLVMIMAMGIAVRSIAPHIKDKRTDPAVVVMDEGGSFAISTLSGHAGGANDLARLIAAGIGCAAVITTATDVAGVPAVDVLARDLRLEPDPPAAAKRINAALARGERVPVYSEYHLPLPEGGPLELKPWAGLGDPAGRPRVLVTGRDRVETAEGDLILRPRNLAVGVGCKRGKSTAEIMSQIKGALREAGRSPDCVMALATIGARIGEEGLTGAALALGVPLLYFGAGEINGAIERFGLEKSGPVMHRMGVGGVCEPAAMLACRKGKMLVPKRKGPGITVAVAEEESGWWESAPDPAT